MDEDLIVSGNGDNTLLICAKDDCEWVQPYPMAEPLANLLKAATEHLNEVHSS